MTLMRWGHTVCGVTPTTAAYRMADRLAGGQLVSVLTEQRATGAGWETIARHLHNTYGIEVTGETLRRWGNELGIKSTTAEPDEATA